MSLETLKEVIGYTFDGSRFFVDKNDAIVNRLQKIIDGCTHSSGLSLHHILRNKQELIELLEQLEDDTEEQEGSSQRD